MWAILLVTLPTQPNAVRLRIWRALKALGCVALRDGAYLLPADHVAALETLATEVREHGGTASVMSLSSRDDAQRDEILAQFDRSEALATWRDNATATQLAFEHLGETEARRRLRVTAEALDVLRSIDYYPGPAMLQAEAHLITLRQSLDARFSRGEPRPLAKDNIARLDRKKFQHKRWATRARPWVDRLACAWLIRRFIDAEPKFLWLDDPARAPRGIVGFDYDGARFTHIGARVTFEVMAASFDLAHDAKLKRIAQVVHYLDVGGIPTPEAAGLEMVLAGLREVHTDDDELIVASGAVFDALYASPITGS